MSGHTNGGEDKNGGSGGNIKVVVRCRPLNSRELTRGAKGLIKMEGNQTILYPPGAEGGAAKEKDRERREHVFSFDKSYWSAGPRDDPAYASQQTVYEDIGVGLLDHSFAGYNCCIFAYGQTGSGKSYSMMGYGEDKGIIPLVTEELFTRIEAKKVLEPAVEYTLEASYIEIYQEKVRDLLNPKNKGPLRIREHPSLGPYVEDLSKLVVQSYSQMMTLMDEGSKARTVAATNMNETSSRSHAVFTLILTQKRHDDATNMTGEKVSKVSLVDLAGSERANSTGATGARLKEGANINRSLTTLGKVIQALAAASNATTKTKKRKDEHIPYRDSALTWLLKESLGGNSKTCMIATISPADYEETLSTLRYADQAKQIRTNAVVNEDPNAKLIRELKEELVLLRQRAAAAPDGEAAFDESVPPEKQLVTYKTRDGELRTVTKLELQENLEASEKLMASLNESWEEKLAKTQEIHMAREQALEELGISLDKTKTLVGVHAPKKFPHLVNLNEDPLQNECLLYSIPPGATTVGNTSSSASIRLSSPRILDEHCTFINADGKVSLEANDSATVLVNGKPIAFNTPTTLESGFRIIIDWHVFRFSFPEAVRAQRIKDSYSMTGISEYAGEAEPSEGGRETPVGNVVDWTYARREALSRMALRGEDLDMLDDRELDSLFEDITRARTSRRRPDSMLSTPPTESAAEKRSVFDVKRDVERFDRVTEVEEGEAGINPWQNGDPELSSPTRNERTPTSSISGLADRFRSNGKPTPATTPERSQQVQQMEDEIRLLRRVALQNRWESLNEKLSGIMTERERYLAERAVRKWRRHPIIHMAKGVAGVVPKVSEANTIAKKHNVDIEYRIVFAEHEQTSSVDGFAEGVRVDSDVAHSGSNFAAEVKILVADHSHAALYTWPTHRFDRQLQLMRRYDTAGSESHHFRGISSQAVFGTEPCPEYSHVGSGGFIVRPDVSGGMAIRLRHPHNGADIGAVSIDSAWDALTDSRGRRRVRLSVRVVEGLGSRGESMYMRLAIPIDSQSGEAAISRTSKVFDLERINLSRFQWQETIAVEAGAELGLASVDLFAKINNAGVASVLRGLPDVAPVAAVDDRSDHSSRHIILCQITVLELNSRGEYTPTEFDRENNLFLLRQGIQRRLRIRLRHNSGRALALSGIDFVTVLPLIKGDDSGISRSPTMLKALNQPTAELLPDGTGILQAEYKLEDVEGMEQRMGSSGSAEFQLSYQVCLADHRNPGFIAQGVRYRIMARDSRRRSGILDYLRTTNFTPESNTLYTLSLPATSGNNLDSGSAELLSTYLSSRARQTLAAEVEVTRCISAKRQPFASSRLDQEELARKCLGLWQMHMKSRRFTQDRFEHEVRQRLSRDDPVEVAKADYLREPAKQGWLNILSDPLEAVWTRRWICLNRPYLRVYEGSDLRSEVQAISLEGSTVRHETEYAMLMQVKHLFTIVATTNTTLLSANCASDLADWLKCLRWK